MSLEILEMGRDMAIVRSVGACRSGDPTTRTPVRILAEWLQVAEVIIRDGRRCYRHAVLPQPRRGAGLSCEWLSEQERIEDYGRLHK